MFGKNRPNPYLNYGYSGQMMHGGPINHPRTHQPISANQPYPFQPPQPTYDWNLYQQQNPYYPQQYQPYGQNYQPGPAVQSGAYSNQQFQQKDSQFLFQNPLQPQEEMVQQNQYMPLNGYPMMNPYPKQNAIPKQAGGMQSFMNSFKSQDGSVDFNKMMNTAGQMMNAVNQVSSLVKGFGGMFKA
ncbi:YppG family protein [Neobacillus ginsengisoli]|uniref:Spore coat protein n=1 Tax=Neobacillus ginsengisoli TaxID=904295 RepID=A0ABT9XPU0_9BACI|nr:YppG family protein [Neobacillus ginsengisoli]MDQ0197552.1 hypothetical protein [Neobacillus ginsengisoli]